MLNAFGHVAQAYRLATVHTSQDRLTDRQPAISIGQPYEYSVVGVTIDSASPRSIYPIPKAIFTTEHRFAMQPETFIS